MKSNDQTTQIAETASDSGCSAAPDGSAIRLKQARELLLAIHEQLESPARNTTMSSYRRDGSVIISSDIRQRVREWLTPND